MVNKSIMFSQTNCPHRSQRKKQTFFFDKKKYINISNEKRKIGAKRHLTKAYIAKQKLNTPRVQAIKQNKQLKSGGTQLPAIPKVKSLQY